MFSDYDSSQTIYIECIPLNAVQYALLLRDLGERCHYRDWVIHAEPDHDTYTRTEAFEYAYSMYEDSVLNIF